jgi:hypothetical protein
VVATPDALIARARERAALADLGADGWQEGLDRLLSSVETDLGGDDAAVASVEEIVVRRLVTRLRVEGWYAQHGAAAHAPVGSLLVIVGLPRTGTTALHHLLSLDPRFRYLRQWEVKDPVPPPDVTTEAADPRRPTEPPAANVQHITAIDGAAEDGEIHTLQFRHGEISLPLPTYTRWWVGADHRTFFPAHERFLRMLHAHRPPCDWLLKFPNYLFELRALVDHYPQARFVWTHRDVTAVVPSTCSVVLEARRQRVPSWTPDLAAFGRDVLDYLVAAIERALSDRHVLGDDRFLDVAQRDLQHDAIAVAERVYDFIGVELTAGVRTTMQEWTARNERGARGTHAYRAGDYGLHDRQVEHAFTAYLAAYGACCTTETR